jgi:hypothetical protein
MSSEARYHIPDEPRASALSHLVVDPLWPLLAQMLAGSWLALPWFALNGIALGSPTRSRDWLLIVCSLAGSALLILFLSQQVNAGSLSDAWARIAFLTVIVLKIAVAYLLYFNQTRVLELWQHFGGQARNGLFVVVLGAMFGRTWVMAAAGSTLLKMVLA